MTPVPNPEQHFRTVAQSARDGIITITGDSTVQYANPAVERIFGYSPDELVGRSVTDLMPDELARTHRALTQYLQTGERELDWDDVRLSGVHREGHEVPLSISLSEFEQDDTRYFTGIIRDVTDQHRRETQLTELNRFAQELTDAESSSDVCDRTVTAAQTTLDQPLVVIQLYREDEGRLEPCAWTSEVTAITDDGTLFPTDRSIPWEAFVTQDRHVVGNLPGETQYEGDETPLRSVIVHPLGSYGVFIAGARQTDAFTDEDVDITNILVGNAYSALERVDRERSLREQKNQLEAKTQSLDRLRRINDVIRDLTKALREATGRDEITSEVCRQLATAEPYQFVWFGSYDHASDGVTVEAAAGEADDYLDAITIDLDSEDSIADYDPAGRAIQTRTTQIENHIYQDPPFEPWRQAAIQRGYRASLAVPIVYEDTLYGVLSPYADEAGVFDQMEVAVLRELGGTIGYTLNVAERKQAFTSERSVELAFDVRELDDPILGLVDETDSADAVVELENLVERQDGSTTLFFSVHDLEKEAVLERVQGHPQIDEIRVLDEQTDGCLFECHPTDSTVWAQLLRRGSAVREAVATQDSARIVIRIPQRSEPRSFDTLLDDQFGDVELVARKESEEPVMTPEEFEAEFREQLTERQEEVLQTAYYAGYFEWPRETQSGELADVLGIAQPTVSRHIRSSEETFLSMVYDES